MTPPAAFGKISFESVFIRAVLNQYNVFKKSQKLRSKLMKNDKRSYENTDLFF
jgi:hypothetical protein